MDAQLKPNKNVIYCPNCNKKSVFKGV